MSMMKCGSEKLAAQMAAERDQCYGWSIFNGGWYVGAEEALRAIGVVEPKPAAKTGAKCCVRHVNARAPESRYCDPCWAEDNRGKLR